MQLEKLTERVELLEKEAAENRERFRLVAEIVAFIGKASNDTRLIYRGTEEFAEQLRSSIPKD